MLTYITIIFFFIITIISNTTTVTWKQSQLPPSFQLLPKLCHKNHMTIAIITLITKISSPPLSPSSISSLPFSLLSSSSSLLTPLIYLQQPHLFSSDHSVTHLRHERGQLQSQVTVERKATMHDFLVHLVGQQQLLLLCLLTTTVLEVQPAQDKIVSFCCCCCSCLVCLFCLFCLMGRGGGGGGGGGVFSIVFAGRVFFFLLVVGWLVDWLAGWLVGWSIN